MKQINVGVIGLSGRGYGLLKDAVCQREGVRIAAVCDLYPDRVERAAALVQELDGNLPVRTMDYREVLKMDEIDTILIFSAWEPHIEIAVAAMRAGKAVGCEVGGAYSIDDCWLLVRTQEETGMPCMLMENCCFGRTELMVLNMVRQGLFGSIVHCAGGYCHDLRVEIAGGRENRHYRLRNYMNRNCENYPTHELGPIAKVLNLNRGNRMVSLTSTASCARGLNDFLQRKEGGSDLANYPFAQGDVVTTVIRCAHGETITLTLDTTLPRSYSRGFTVRGTRGMYAEDTDSVFLDGVHDKYDFDWKPMWNNAIEYREQYEHPIWRKHLADENRRGGHGGMDGIEFDAFFKALQEGHEMPIDVYDMASWMSISALSERSIAMGSAPVEIPDFTNGKWLTRKEEEEWEFCLSKVCPAE